jgi:hypothetical protein
MPFIKAVQRWFTLNHIGEVESRYQARMLRQRRGWLAWIGRRLVDAALIVAIFLALLSIVAGILRVDTTPFENQIPLLLIFPPITAVILHFSLLFRALAYSSNSITREQQSQSWDLLVLTGVDARQIVRGKWVATVRNLWPAFLRLGILRACIILWLGSIWLRPFASYAYTPDEFRYILPSVFDYLLSFGFVIFITACNLLFTAASGVFASARHRSSGVSLARSIGTRWGVIALLLIAAALVIFVLSRMFFAYTYNNLLSYIFQVISLTLASMLDNGSVLGGSVVLTRLSYGSDYSEPYSFIAYALPVMIGLTLLYLGLTYWLLRRTERYLVRQGVLPPGARPAVSTGTPLETTPSPMV